MKFDELGFRMKQYEKIPQVALSSHEPIVARLDGRCFSSFTKRFDRPFDRDLRALMARTAKFLIESFGAIFAYTQSDEITLVFFNENENAEALFGGKTHKINSVLASATTCFFNKSTLIYPNEYPQFDCRSFNVPTKGEAANCVLWRYFDCKRNSISSLARHYFSHDALLGKSIEDRLEMLRAEGVEWEELPNMFKYGISVVRQKGTHKGLYGIYCRKKYEKRVFELDKLLVKELIFGV